MRLRVVALLLAMAAFAIALAGPPRAHAGTYEVLACDAMPNHGFDAWQRERPTVNGTMLVYASYCDGDPGKVNDIDSNGLISRSGYDGSWTEYHDGQGWVMRPAPNTKILGLTWAGTLRRPSTPAGTEGWTTWIADSGNGAFYLRCPPNTGSCTYNQTTPRWLPLPAGAPGTGIEVGSYCIPNVPQRCLNAWTSPYFNTAAAAMARIRYADVRVEDVVSPTLSLTGGGLTGSGWLRGTQNVTYSSSDNSGVRANRIYVDGAQQGADTTRSCDFSNSVPCPGSVTDAYSVATGTLSDGSHSFRVEAVDAAGNATGSATGSFNVDNHAPAAPAGVAADNAGVSATPAFTIRFANPAGQAAPVTTVHYTVCPASSNGDCQTGSSTVANGGSGQQNAVTGSFGIAQPGAYTVALWLEDAAGNAEQGNASAPIRLQLGEDRPVPPQLADPPAGWFNGTSYVQRIGLPAGAPVPASGVAGYAVTADGSTPGATVNAPGRDATYTFTPAEGIATIRARTVSGAGTTSDTAEVTLKVDRTAPATSVLGAGASGVASSGPLDLTLLGTDQPGLSGMGGADLDQPVGAGGHLDYQVDGGATVQVRGDEASLHIADAGPHTVAFRAYDVAGNASELRTLEVIVGTPPPPGQRAHAGFWDETSSTATFAAAPSFAAACPPLATLTANADATVDQAAPDQRLGSATTLTVRSQSGGNARTLVGFELPALGDCAVLSAQLRLYRESGPEGRTLAAYRAGSAWNESSVSWGNRPGPAGAAATGTVPAGGWMAVDVTAQVRAMYRSGNNGLIVEDASESSSAPQAEAFSAADSAAASQRPQLVVTFG